MIQKLWSLKVVGTAENFWLTEESGLSTSEFGPKWNKIERNSEYQSRRGFHKLSKEGGNSKLRYTKEPWSDKIGRILEMRVQIGIDF
jgi:hypothetical protein